MKYFFCLFMLSSTLTITAQKLKKADKATIANLQQNITYLADDKLEGRRLGSAGEKLAYEYITAAFQKAGLTAKGDSGSFIQSFPVYDGKMINIVSHFIINDHDLVLNEEYFPFAFCPNTTLETTASIALRESGSPWFYDIKELIDANKNNPHYDLEEGIKQQATDAAKKGANSFIIYNSSGTADELKFNSKEQGKGFVIPVIYVTPKAHDKYMKDETALLDIKLKVDIGKKERTGHNVIGFIDNHAANTIILGAHYDHLGYGEDKNSLYIGEPSIHNGADDNASGTAALIEFANMLPLSKLKSNNYLFIAFSGEELGLFGSKYFTEHPTIDLAAADYMINMDMVGRLKDSTHALTIGGYGTSPSWSQFVPATDKYFKIGLDSSGTGPSDHTSFYRKDIPVLFFFTGTHSDYHKPSDDADKINYVGELMVIKFIYAIIEKADKKGKLPFSKTRETQMNSKSTFKVSLGIMPDYTFSGPGVRADGISAGRIAEKVGIKTGDIIMQLGDYKFADVMEYTEVLKKFNKGDATKVKVKRGNEELSFDIVF